VNQEERYQKYVLRVPLYFFIGKILNHKLAGNRTPFRFIILSQNSVFTKNFKITLFTVPYNGSNPPPSPPTRNDKESSHFRLIVFNKTNMVQSIACLRKIYSIGIITGGVGNTTQIIFSRAPNMF